MITNQEERPLKEDSFLSLLWNIIDDLIIVLNHDSQYKIEKINNSKILKRLGYFKKDILNKSFLDFVYKGDIKILIKLLKKADYFNPKTHEIRLEGKEKETIWVEIKVIKFIKDDKKRILVILKDITKQKNLEYLFRLNEERFRKIANQIPEIRFWKLFSPKHVENALQNSYKILENVMENIPQYVYWKDLNLSFLGCNANFAKLAGLEDSIQIINKNNNGLDWNPKLLKEIEKKEITVIKNREPEFNSVEEWELKHGIKIWVQINRIPLFDAENEMRGILVTFEDISELKKAFELLQIEHDKLERIMETSPVGIIIINSRGKITYVNSFVEKILQIKKEECFNLSILEYMDNILEAENVDIEDSSNINNLLSLLKEPLSNVKLKVKLSNGNIVLLLLNSSPLLDRNKKLENVIIIIEDITEREQARQKIKESEEKYKNLLETSKVGVLEVDLREQKLSYMNPMLMNITGHNNKEFVYENFMKKIVHPDDVNNLLNSNEDDDVEFRILTKNRNLKRLHGKKSNLYDDEGNLIGFRLWVEDITEKKRYEELIYELNVNFLNFTTDTKKNIQLLLNTCVKLLRGTLILYTNKIEKDGKVLYKIMSNKGDFLELSESEFKNNYFLYQYYKENHDFPQEYFDLDILKKSRSDYFVKKYGLKSCYGKLILSQRDLNNCICIFYKENHEITDQDRLVLFLICDALEIETKRHEAQKQLEERNRILKEINKLKSDLISRTSHELKTPLISIKGFSELLLNLYGDQFNDDIITIINDIRAGSDRLERIINTLIETSKLEQGKINLSRKKENLTFLIKYCINQLKGVVESRYQKIETKLPEKLEVFIDRERMYEVISNLLLNAIKYTPKGGKIKITASKENNRVVVMIKDNGIGITEKEKKFLFTQFGKIERYGQGWDVDIEGSGLGLYIAKEIVKLHGGEIWVESEGRHKGSCFFFSIPIN